MYFDNIIIGFRILQKIKTLMIWLRLKPTKLISLEAVFILGSIRHRLKMSIYVHFKFRLPMMNSELSVSSKSLSQLSDCFSGVMVIFLELLCSVLVVFDNCGSFGIDMFASKKCLLSSSMIKSSSQFSSSFSSSFEALEWRLSSEIFDSLR